MIEATKRPAVLFVAGPNRSGTTLLGQMLAQHPRVFAAGELAHLWRSVDAGAHCQCGQPVGSCAFWRPVVEQALRESGVASAVDAERLRLASARTRHLWRARSPGSFSVAQRRYVELLSVLHRTLLSSAAADVLVDTSKNSTELLLVARASATAAVHLIRSPYGVAASERDGGRFSDLPPIDRPPSRRAALSALNWLKLNHQAAFAARHLDEPPLRLSYESLIARPQLQLDRVIELLSLPKHEWERRGQEFNLPSEHLFNGNPSRYRSGWQALRPSDMGAGLTRKEVLVIRAIVALGSFGRYEPPGLAGARARRTSRRAPRARRSRRSQERTGPPS